LKVLIAEDNDVNQEIAAGLLEVLGCEVTLVQNGREAVEAAENGAFDLVLMDCQMPVMDGIEATRAIRQLQSGAQKMPIIALTANDIVATRDECLAAGMNDLLGKPFTLEDLSKMLDRWRDETRAEASVSSKAIEPTALLLNAEPIEALRALDPDGERRLVQRTIEKFLCYSEELVVKLSNAVDLGDSTEVSRIAHSLKSSSANLGATDLSRQCAELEKRIADCGMPQDLEKRLVDLQAQHQLAKQALQAMASGS
jgi:CheY-like chemotaxis protein